MIRCIHNKLDKNRLRMCIIKECKGIREEEIMRKCKEYVAVRPSKAERMEQHK